MNRSGKPAGQLPEDLVALEAVLAGKRVSEEHKDLEQLVNQLQNERPKPKEGLALQLFDRTFMQPKHRRFSWASRFLSRQTRVPAIAALVVAIIAVSFLATNELRTGKDHATMQRSRQGSAEPASGHLRALVEKNSNGHYAQVSEADSRVRLLSENRKVERNAAVTLQTSSSKVEQVAQSVLKVADRYQGIVLNSSLELNSTTGNEATFRLRIPSERFTDTLTALSDLATVKERSDETQDITRSYVSTSSELKRFQAERRGLLRAFARANTLSEIEKLRTELRLNQTDINRLGRRLARLKQRVDFTNLQLTVVGENKAKVKNGAWTPKEAWKDLKDLLITIGTIVFVGIIILTPPTLIAAFIISFVRLRRRRLRRQILEDKD